MTGIETLMEIGEDTGTAAVIEVLKQMKVVRYDHPSMAWKFTEITVSNESLTRAIATQLGRAR